MKIDIWSDIACPYCYIGKRKLEIALSKFEHAKDIKIVWHSYELDPSLPKVADKKPFYKQYAQKFGTTEDKAKEKFKELTAIAAEVGLNYNFEILIGANTSDALRLVKLAEKWNLADAAEEALFKAYFEQGKDVSDRNLLIEIGVALGLKKEEIIDMLDSDIFLADIQQDIIYSEKELNLQYIPFYIFNGKHIIQGSLAPDDYLKILEKSYREWISGNDAPVDDEIISGQSCSLDGVCS